jgi:N-acetylglutamate synthase-like GNAT family acetyltransferase
MKVNIRECMDWETYASAWDLAMQDLYWHTGSPVFDFNRDEELAEMNSVFGQEGHLFLVAEDRKSGFIQGAVGVRQEGENASLRRWEPAVTSSLRETSVGRDLLRDAMKRCRENGIKRMRVLVKYPFDDYESAAWHLTLYQSLGFKQVGYTGVDLTMKLAKKTSPVEPDIEFEVITGESLRMGSDGTRGALLCSLHLLLLHREKKHLDSNRQQY